MQGITIRILTVFGIFGTISSGVATAQNIKDVWQTGLRDASFTAVVTTGNQRELAKINKDFANSYRFKSSTVKLKEPMKLRLESKVEDQNILFIVNGVNRLVRVPQSNINIRENLAKSPGKRQTLLDFGMITPSLFNDFFTAKFIRNDRATGDLVFDMNYVPRLDDSTRHRVWIDPQKRYVTKREWYSQIDGRLLATFLYENPKSDGGVWFPTRVTVKNADNKVAGITDYKGLSINGGIDDSLFKVN